MFGRSYNHTKVLERVSQRGRFSKLQMQIVACARDGFGLLRPGWLTHPPRRVSCCWLMGRPRANRHCDACGRTYSTPANLRRHQRTAHMRLKPHVCLALLEQLF